MAKGLLRFFSLHQRNDPEQLIDTVIKDIRHKLTEAKLQLLSAELAGKQLDDTSADTSYTLECIKKLQNTLHELESKRNALIIKAKSADARLAIERALMETNSEPAQAALDMLAEDVEDIVSEADAIAEVRQISNNIQGSNDD